MNISKYKSDAGIGEAHIGADSSCSGAIFSGRDIACAETNPCLKETEYRSFLLDKIDFFRKKKLRNNKLLVGLFPSCARLSQGREFMRLAAGNDKGSDNSNELVNLIMSCASHPKFAPTLSKVFSDFPLTVPCDALEDPDELLASPSGKAANGDAMCSDGKSQELPTDVSESVPNRVDPFDESEFSEDVVPLHAQLDDQSDSSWSADRQKLFSDMRDMLVIQRMSIEDMSAFRGQRFFKRDVGNNVNPCSPFSAYGSSATSFYQLSNDDSYEKKLLSKILAHKRISHKSIKDELEFLSSSLSDAAYAKLLPDNCDLAIQVYKNGKQGHTRNFSVWYEGDVVEAGAEAPIQVGVQRQKAVLRLTAESLAMLNARMVYDEEIAFEQRWISVSGDSSFVDCIKKLIALQKTDENNDSQES